jgi:CHASE2 domain-containing sensor protein/class 3 adenylate cyclase
MLFKLRQKINTSVSELSLMAIAIMCFTAILFAVRQVGGLQTLELLAYDQMLRWRKDTGVDPRLLIVTIGEEDIRKFKWPIADAAIAEVLKKLQALKPRAIGLDIYRDIPVEPGHDELIEQLKQPNTIVIRNLDRLRGVPAPPSSLPERVGFNDIPIDPDGVVRRQLLFAETEDGILYSFSLRLALIYLEAEGITPTASKENPQFLQLGKSVFEPVQPSSGSYQKIDSGGYQILLNYRTRNNVAQTIGFSQVLFGEVKPEWVKDKIVVIGTTAPSLKDSFFTPYKANEQQSSQIWQQWLTKFFGASMSPKKMSGAIVHAQTIGQLLDAATGQRSLLWFWSDDREDLWILAWIVIGCAIGLLFRHPVSLGIGVIDGLVILFGTATIIFHNSGWVPTATPAIGFLLTVGIVVSDRAYQNYLKHEIVTKLLGQNTSPEIAKALWDQRDELLNDGKLTGTILVATVMFMDIKGFTSISEKTESPEDLLKWLNELLEEVAHQVTIHKGIINKFTGDGAMAVFGVPLERTTPEEIAEDAQNCVKCSLALSEYLDRINEDWQKRGLPSIQMRIGIFTGPVVAGSLGGKDRIEYGVIGDTVNTAARLEACEKERQPSDCRILIGKQTLEYLSGKFEAESWGDLALKGKEETVSVYRIIDRPLTKSP